MLIWPTTTVASAPRNRIARTRRRGKRAGYLQRLGRSPRRGVFEPLEPRCVLATFTVNDASDVVNPDPALTSLREAIELANSLAGSDLIEFAPSIEGQTLDVVEGQLEILDDLTVHGPGAGELTWDAHGENRLVRVASDVTVQIHGITLRRGTVDSDNGGALWNQGTLTLDQVIVRDSFVLQPDQPHGFGGGGIYNDVGAELTMISSQIIGSISQGDGGAILNRGALTLRDDSYLAGNQANYSGGGIDSRSGTVTLIDSVVENNVAMQFGGGIFTEGATTIQRSTVFDNFAAFWGGGAYVDSDGNLTLTSSTVSGNRANGFGGGIYNGGSLLATNTTIAANSADDDGGLGDDTGGGIKNAGPAVLHNTIVAGNTETVGGFFDSNVTGTALDPASSHNLIGPRGSGGLRNGVNGNLVGVDAKFEIDPDDPDGKKPRLKDNGGPTPTHLLLPGSPAIDAGSDQYNPFLDQRGRPVTDIDGVGASVVDIGSYELQQFASSTWRSEVNDASQFGPGEATVFGFGFDDGKQDSSVQKRPEFLGFQFDTGPLTLGHVKDGPFKSKWGGELRADFSGRLGLNLGFYINSGSVDVNYDGMLNYVIDDPGNNQPIRIDTVLDVEDGSLYTISPKVGAYADLVLELDARIGATGCVWDCVGADASFELDERFEIFSINRQELDVDDLDGDGNRREPLFYNENGQETPSSQGAATPILDGDIRLAFSQLIDEVVDQTKEKVRDSRAARQLQKADQEERRGQIDVEEGRRELNDAKTEADREKARQKIVDGQSKVSNAEVRRAKATADMVKRELGGTPKAGIGVSFSEASGSLLGIEATVSAGVGVDGVASAEKELGTLALTLPDVNLRDVEADLGGTLAASTSQFEPDSAQDAKRQLARMSIDVGGMLGPLVGLPTGKYSVDLGPLGVEVQTVSYNIIPQVDVTQDVQVTPYAKGYQFAFDRPVFVEINNVLSETAVTSIEFLPSDSIEVHADGQPVTVTPTLTLANRFTNQIGLEVDLRGALAAFRLGLSVAGQEIVGVGPLITHAHRFGTLSLGNVFDQTFDLTAGGGDLAEGLVLQQELTPFTIGVSMTGNSPGTPLPVDVATPAAVQTGVPLFVSTHLLEESETSDQLTYYQNLQYDVQHNQVTSVVVFHDGITLALPDGTSAQLQKAVKYDLTAPVSTFQLVGFDPRNIAATPQSLTGMTFAQTGDVEISAVRSRPIDVTVDLNAVDNQNQGQIDELAAVQLRPTVSLSPDIDGDGVSSPLTDGVLLIRYLRGLRGAELTENAVNPAGDRTDPDDVAQYIEDVLLQTTTDPDSGLTQQPLDIDGDGMIGHSTDGILLTRYLAGFVGDVLISDAVGLSATRRTADEIRAYLGDGIVTANNDEVLLRDEFDRLQQSEGVGFETSEIVDRGDRDLYGVEGHQTATEDATPGSSAAAANDRSIVGAAPASAQSFDRSEPREANESFEYQLSTYGQMVTYDAYYLDDVTPANLVSRVAQGSPMDFSQQPELMSLLADVDQDRINALSSRIVARQDTKVLGVQEPIFIQAPDAAGYTYQAPAGYRFTSVQFDTDYGGNLYLEPEFDLYLHDAQADQWDYHATIPATEPFAFSGEGVDRFQLFGLAFPNQSLHRAGNEASPGTQILSDGTVVYELPTTTGFTLAGSGDAPTIELTQEAPRQALATPEVLDDPPCVTNCNLALGEDALFQVVRRGPDVQMTIRRQDASKPVEEWIILEQRSEPLASSTGLLLEGDEYVDHVTVDNSGGPIRLPLRFDAGEGVDQLTLLGQNKGLDLVARDQVTGVERIDVRGTGPNSLVLDVDVVRQNSGTANVLIAQADADDTIHIGAGWTVQGTEQIDGLSYSVYTQSDATLKISTAASPLLDTPAQAVRSAIPLPRANASDAPDNMASDTDEPAVAPPVAAEEARRRIIKSARPDTLSVIPNESFAINIMYDTDPVATTTGLHLRMHFDSSQLRVEELFGRWPDGFTVEETVEDGPCLGPEGQSCYGLDGDPQTDTYLHLLWLDPQGQWPVRGPEPISLLQAQFVASPSFHGETMVRFTGSLAAGVDLETTPVKVRQGQLPGDFDASGTVDQHDIALFCEQHNSATPDPAYDLTGDGRVDVADRDRLIRNILGTTYGDANLDGRFDSSDLVQVFQQGEYEDVLAGNSDWSAGDWNCDGDFNSSDLVLAFQAGGYELQRVASQPAGSPTASPDVAAALLAWPTPLQVRITPAPSELLTIENDSAETFLEVPVRSHDLLFTRTRGPVEEPEHHELRSPDELIADDLLETLAIQLVQDLRP